jgi:hypothetical protein
MLLLDRMAKILVKIPANDMDVANAACVIEDVIEEMAAEGDIGRAAHADDDPIAVRNRGGERGTGIVG